MTISTFHLYDNSDPTMGTPLEEAQVRVYSVDGVTFITMGTTDPNGEVVFDLVDDTYWVRFFKTGFAFDTKLSATINVALTNTFDVPADNLEELPPSAADNICRVSGYLVGAGGEPFPGATIQFLVNTFYARIVGSRAVVASKITARTDSTGRLEVELIQGGVYDAIVEGWEDEVLPITVPKVQAVNITELIWPYAARVDLGTASVTVAQGDTEEIPITVVTSSFLETPYETFTTMVSTIQAGGWVTASSSDIDVATVTLTESVDVVGVSPGVATISFSQLETERRLPGISPPYGTLIVTVV